MLSLLFPESTVYFVRYKIPNIVAVQITEAV